MATPLRAVPSRRPRLPHPHAALGYLRRRRIVGAPLAVLALRSAQAQGHWPNQPIRLLVGFPAGGSADIPARALAQAIGDTLGQPIVVENRAGAGGAIAAEAVAHASADGHMLLMLPSGALLLPMLRRSLPFDPYTDFQPIAMVAEAPPVLCVPSALGMTDLAAFIAQLRRPDHALTYALSGPGTSSQINFALLMQATGTTAVAAMYRGDPDMLRDLLANRVQATFLSVQTALPHIASGALVALGVAGETRCSAMPGVPSMAELGLPSVAYVPWWGIAAPKGLAHPIRDRLAVAIRRVVTSADFRQRLAQLGADPRDLGPQDFAALIAAERQRLAAIATTAGLKPE
ncbi:tripartite tricarboxylate transporter substrate binding protein [Reyranella sp. CPCC 100927]|uniref:Bug family tripartite tricarboxylate transporter substrate binding protein n=1 Tax=Reyranella sp. CPCC 100927 TaxID=2599616 RepID=UPI0015B3A6A7|nr:tripartite tricarboxylate transporter substrate binding protein [Reyranella sp. CPCC 100927]